MEPTTELTEVVGSGSFLLVACALALALLVLTLLKLWASGPKGNAVLLVGPCDAGKTTLFHQLRDGSTHAGTVASMQENVAECVLAAEKGGAARPLTLIDIPGHPRLRGKFDSYVDRARGIVFLVDSVDFMPKKAAVAEQLCDALCHPSVARRRLPVLLACNKQDMGSHAHTVDFVRKQLEKEVGQMRSTRGSLADVGDGSGGGGSAAAPLGVPGEPFTFESHAQAHGVRVTAVGASAVDTGGVADVAAFLRRCVPAAALVGAIYTGKLARKRRYEVELLNDKLRQINAELRRQWEDAGTGGGGSSSLVLEAGSIAAAVSSVGGDAEAAAREVLAAAAAEMAAARASLETSLAAPAAAHPWEGLGPGGRLSLASARRRVAAAIRDTKLLLRASAAECDAAAAGAGGDPSSVPTSLRGCFSLLEEAECLSAEMGDRRAVRVAVHLKARALRLAGDLRGAARELQRCLEISQQLGQSGGVDVLGELGDVLTELGDYAAAAEYYDRCISAIQGDGGTLSSALSSWD
eukprot:scaffold21.g2206.t1